MPDDEIGSWRIDGTPFGQYILQIASSATTQLAAPRETQITLVQRGVQQTPPAAVTLTGHAIFLPVVMR